MLNLYVLLLYRSRHCTDCYNIMDCSVIICVRLIFIAMVLLIYPYKLSSWSLVYYYLKARSNGLQVPKNNSFWLVLNTVDVTVGTL